MANEFEVLCEGLEKHGLKQERKALRLSVKGLEYTSVEDEENWTPII